MPDFPDSSPDVADSGEDPDGDGLSNLDEFWNHTQPKVADTGRGGKNDGSEVARGGSPFNPSDDAVSDVVLR